MTGVLIRLAIITGDGDLRTMASDSLRGVRDIMIQFPTGAGHWLSVLDFYLSDQKEAVIVTAPGSSGPSEMLRRLASTHLTNAIIVSAPQDAADASQWPVFQGRSVIDGKPTAYICRNYACQLPTTDPDTMMSQVIS